MSKKSTWSLAVLWTPPTNQVSSGMSMPRSPSRARTAGRLARAANARPFGAPCLPPHAPQSCADSCGLFTEIDPCPQKTTSRAKWWVMPMLRSTASIRSACSTVSKPRPLSSRSRVSSVAGWATSRRRRASVSTVHRRGASTRPISGTDCTRPVSWVRKNAETALRLISQ